MLSNAMLQEFISYARTEGLAGASVEAYARDVRQFLNFKGNTPVTAEAVNSFILSISLLATNTRARKQAAIRVFLKMLEERQDIPHSVLLQIDPIKHEFKRPRPIDRRTFESMLERIGGEDAVRDRTIAITLFGSGLRAEEACSINVKDVWLDRCQIRVTGKGTKDRLAPIFPHSLPCFHSYLQDWRPVYAIPVESAFFIRRSGRRMDRRELSRVVTGLGLKVDVPIAAHVLRHGFATDLLNQGVDLETIKEFMGHSKIEQTQAYLAVSRERLLAEARKCHPAFQPTWGSHSEPSS